MSFLHKAAVCTVLTSATALGMSGLQASSAEGPAVHDCSAAQAASDPKVILTNGTVNAIVYLPDSHSGYYRASRFDWSGVVGCLAYNGHTYFGQWFPRYDPLLNDSISGPVEEFRSAGGASSVGYDDAKPGELFLKPGVGVLRRIDEKPYNFFTPYPLVDGGKWTSENTRTGVTFTQKLNTPLGYAYTYRKVLRLEAHAPVLVLEHELKNTGKKPMELDVYDHDFYMLDGAPTGPGMVARFPFAPKVDKPFTSGGVIEGNQITYERELEPKQTVGGYLTGYSNKASDYDFTVEDTRSGVGVEQTSDHPLSKVYFWSIRTTICPEGYIHLSIAPGETAHWTIRYRFYSRS